MLSMVYRWFVALVAFTQFYNVYCKQKSRNQWTAQPFYEKEQNVISQLKKSFNAQLSMETLLRNGKPVQVEVPRVIITKISETFNKASAFLHLYFSWIDETLPSWNDSDVYHTYLQNFAGLWTPYKGKETAEKGGQYRVGISIQKFVFLSIESFSIDFECWTDKDTQWPDELIHCGSGTKFDRIFPLTRGIQYKWNSGARKFTTNMTNDVISCRVSNDWNELDRKIRFETEDYYQRFHFIHYFASINVFHNGGYQLTFTIKRLRTQVYYVDLICSTTYAIFITCQYLITVRKGYRLLVALLGLVMVIQNLEPLTVLRRRTPDESVVKADLPFSLFLMQAFSLIWCLVHWSLQKSMKKVSCKVRSLLPRTIFGDTRLSLSNRRGSTGDEELIEDNEFDDSHSHNENTQPPETNLEEDPYLWNCTDALHCIDRFLCVTNAVGAVVFFHLWR